MKAPVWLTAEVVVAVQEELLARFGGLAGIREEGLLDAALNRPRQRHAYLHASLFQLAAAYAHSIVKSHPFVDGNKRTGFMAAYVFLGSNGFELEAPEEEAAVQTLGLAAGNVTEADYAAWLERRSHRIPR